MATVGDKYGPYTCVRRIGEGGMAETFLANQSGPCGFEQRVCIKIIRDDYKNHPKFVEMFFKEATIAASLRHSNIVGVIDASQKDAFMVLELVDGVDLRTLVQAAPGNRLAPEQVVYIAVELVKALDFAHNRRLRGKPDGIIHRDIKPSNILVSYAGEVKLADFGIARAIGSSPDTNGLLRGTPHYMSPEQLNNRPLDARSDLFSLGVVLYELLAGRHPFSEQDGDATIARIAHGKPTPLSETAYRVPAGLAVVVERLLKNDPDERFESALAFAETLDKFAPSHGVYRKVGQLARAARPPETLLPADKTGSPAMLQAVHQEAFTEEIPSSISDDSGSAVAANRLAQLEPIPADPKQSTESVSQRLSSPAPYSGEMPMQSRSVALFGRKLLLLIMAALAVISVSAVFLAITKDSKAVESENIATSNPAASPHPDPSPRPAKEPVGLSDYKKANTNILRSEIESNRANTSREESVVPRPETASTSNVKVRNATKKRAAQLSEAQGKGFVHVGVFPWGKVWIDKRFLGSAPKSVELEAGTHIIAGGIDKPLLSKSIEVKAGAEQQVVINLNKEEK